MPKLKQPWFPLHESGDASVLKNSLLGIAFREIPCPTLAHRALFTERLFLAVFSASQTLALLLSISALFLLRDEKFPMFENSCT